MMMQTPKIQLGLTVRAAETKEELHRATTLMTSAHPRELGHPCDWLRSNGSTYPNFKREHTRIAIWNGELVGALRISTDTLRIGEARLRMGGLGWISIAPRHDAESIRETLIRHTLNYLKIHRYHIALLFGPSNIYEALGFIGALTDYHAEVDCSKTPKPLCRTRIRPIKPGDIPSIQRIQSANASDIACSILRESAHFANQWERIKSATVITDAQGKVEGYILLMNGIGQLHIDEIEGLNATANRELLAYAYSYAAERLIPRLVFHAAPNHPVLQSIMSVFTPESVQLGSIMAGLFSITDLGETLESMIPEWESRISRSLLREMDCEVTLLLGAKPYRIRLHSGAIDIAPQSGRNKFSVAVSSFTQMLTGYRDIREGWSEDRRLITREGRAMLEILFPKRSPYMTLLDRF